MDRNLRSTYGLPLYFGVLSGIIYLIGDGLLYYFINNYKATVKAYGMTITLSGFGSSYGSLVILGYLLFPGIFLILLFSARSEPKRGTGFCVGWMICAILSIVQGVNNLITKVTLGAAMDQTMFPGAMSLTELCYIGAGFAMIACCISLLNRKGY